MTKQTVEKQKDCRIFVLHPEREETLQWLAELAIQLAEKEILQECGLLTPQED